MNPPDAGPGQRDRSRPGPGYWWWPLLAGMFAVVLLRESYGSMLQQWSSSTTFTYGFLVAPISALLLWRERRALLGLPLRPALLPLCLMVPCGLLWVLGVTLSIAFLHHLSAVSLLVLSVWAVAGHTALRHMAFPLGYLLFMVPFGEALVPFLMRLTADFAVMALQLSGVPVYQDGFLFSLPSGDFEVIKACSGIRFLMATLAAGTVFAFLVFRSPWRRALFLLACIVVPVLANLLRTYGVVMVAHLSDLRFGTGEDHILGGTIFFGLILLGLFLVAARFADGTAAPVSGRQAMAGHDRSDGRLVAMSLLASAVVVSVTAAGPTLVASSLGAVTANGLMALPDSIPGWSGPGEASPRWRPAFAGASVERSGVYQSGGRSVAVYIADYSAMAAMADLVTVTNRSYDPAEWRETGSAVVTVTERPWRGYRETVLAHRSDQSRRVVWQWYEVGERPAVSGLQVKLAQAQALLGGAPPGGRAVILSATYENDPGEARRLLDRFLAAACDHYDKSVGAAVICVKR